MKELRKSKGLTLEDLAKVCGCTRQNISGIERGISNPKVSTAKKLADVLGIDWTIFFEEECNLNYAKNKKQIKKCKKVNRNTKQLKKVRR